MREIPITWIIAGLLLSLIALRAFGIDSFITAAMSSIAGYLLGIKVEQIRRKK